LKPVSLKIAGLHSFREPQTVDFARLCEAGLFGIFGPTGSGKSTILDALTLALFGRVDRAANRTRGIINHATDRVVVELVFELHQEGERRRYRVERVYRRTGDNQVQLQAARLVESTGAGEVPLAEKSAVDEAVKKLLGLGVDDFTRAVVLPQGKFDEFLRKVQPRDRRAMLERLFGLEEYGDHLKKKLDREAGAVERVLTACQGELDGMGDASDEALQKAADALAVAERQAGEASLHYQALSQQHAETAQVWNLQEEAARVRSALAALEEEAPSMARIEARLVAHARAARVMPLVREAEEQAASRQQAGEFLEQLREKWPETVERVARAQDTAQEAREVREREEPLLLAQKGELERAVRLEEEVAALKADERALRAELDRLAAQRETAQKRSEELGRQKAVLAEETAQAQEELERTRVDQPWRERVRLALAALRDRDRAANDYQAAQGELAAKEEARAAAQARLAELASASRSRGELLAEAAVREQAVREGRPEEDAALEEEAVALERLRLRVRETGDLTATLKEAAAAAETREREADRGRAEARRTALLLAEAASRREEAEALLRGREARLEGLRVKSQAYLLARTLREGDACPVCGSTHHPYPAVSDTADLLVAAEEELAAAREAAGRIQAELDRCREQQAAAGAAREAAERAAGEAAARVEEVRRRLAERARELPAGWADWSVPEMEGELARREEELRGRRAAMAAWRKRVEEAQTALEAARQAAAEAAVAGAAATSDQRAKALAAEEAAGRAEAARATLERCQSHLTTVRGDLAEDRIAAEQQSVDERDRRRTELDAALKGLERRRQELSSAIEKLAGEINDLHLAISGQTQRHDQLVETLRSKESELTGITQGVPAAQLLAQNATRRQELADAEAEAAASARENAAAREKLQTDLAVAENQVTLANAQYEKSAARLREALLSEGFTGANEAREALLPAAEEEEGSRTLADYRERRTRETNRLADLQNKLAGREVSAAVWRGLQESLVEADAARNRALEDKGARAKDLEKVRQNHARWRELNDLLSAAAVKKDRLDLLKSLFRGNSFVDFLAEEQLAGMTADASERLKRLTNYRYALEVDAEGGFVVRDDANGGVRRPVASLSGGETFVASLALALALSLQIQLKGHYPLEFFFLDEGFGTLDPDLLEVVISTLEKLRLEHLNIGIISHVPELRNRFPRQLVVRPASPSGQGTRLVLESN